MERKEVVKLLTNYRNEREAVQKMIACMREDGISVFYPSSPKIGDKVQAQFNQSEFLDSLLKKCESERRVYKKTLADIKILSDKLDILINSVNELPGHLKLVIIDTLIGAETIEEYALKCEKSSETVLRYRRQAIDIVWSKVNKSRIRTT